MKIYSISYDVMQSYECNCVNPNASLDDWEEFTKNIHEEGFHESHDWIFNPGDQSYVCEGEYPEDTWCCWWVFTDQDLDEEAHTPEESERLKRKYTFHREELIEVKYSTKFDSHEISCDKRYYDVEEGYDDVIINKVENKEHFTIYFTEEASRYRINTDCYCVNIPVSAYTKNKTINEIYRTLASMFSRSIEYKNTPLPLHVLKKSLGLSNDNGPKIISLI